MGWNRVGTLVQNRAPARFHLKAAAPSPDEADPGRRTEPALQHPGSRSAEFVIQ